MKYKFFQQNKNAQTSISERQENGILFIDIEMTMPKKEMPKDFTFEFSFPAKDIYSMWSPSMASDRTLGKNYDWRYTYSKIAGWMPLHCAISHGGQNRACFSVSDCASPVRIRSGICEEDAEIKLVIDFFYTHSSPISKYSATVRVDTRDIPYYDSIYDCVSWWENECGYTSAPVPEHARLPMNSLWYSFHQNLEPEKIVEQCKLSKPLGLESVIIDDGWQTNDSNRGYAFCGDWEPVRMPEMKRLVKEIHDAGMKVILWYSVPFMGEKSKRYSEFSDYILDKDNGMDVHVLDPRYRHIREYLVGTYTRAVREWGLDGLKLDFIDSFVLTDTSVRPDARRDIEALDEAVDVLMTEVSRALREINPDIMIEFRQTYVGPSIRKYGNMLRVGDCPVDNMSNRRGVIDLRLSSGGTAVHSDMIMWHPTDKNESVACQLETTLFGVPQISMLIDKLSDGHYRVLKNYLSFWREHRATLLDGRLTAKNPETMYSQVCASKDDEAVIALYEDRIVEADCERLYVVNVSADPHVIIKGARDKAYKVFDCTGEHVCDGTVDANIFELCIPSGGRAEIKKL